MTWRNYFIRIFQKPFPPSHIALEKTSSVFLFHLLQLCLEKKNVIEEGRVGPNFQGEFEKEQLGGEAGGFEGCC